MRVTAAPLRIAPTQPPTGIPLGTGVAWVESQITPKCQEDVLAEIVPVIEGDTCSLAFLEQSRLEFLE
jgi:hypothetical protein